MTFKLNGVPFDDLFIRKDEYNVGNLWAWSYNAYGQLGDNTVVNKSSPVQTITGGTNWKQLECGASHAAAIRADGTLWMWGRNADGQLGDNSITNKSSPVQTTAGGTNWKQVACGSNQTAAIKTDGTLWMWGTNGNGELGDGTTTSRSSPVQTVAGGTDWKYVTSGHLVTAAVKTDGTLWLWGYNNYGQLGDNTRTSKSSPIQTIAGGTNWKSAAFGYSVAAIKTDGTLWTWGQNNYGQLGDNTVVNKSSPVQTTAGGTNWKQVACGTNHTAAIKTDGTLWTWGLNNFGQLGDNTRTSKSSPAQTITGGTNWKQVACGHLVTAAVKTDGTLWLWGYNSLGQLGDNTTEDKSSPVQTVAGGTTWRSVSASNYNIVAIKRE